VNYKNVEKPESQEEQTEIIWNFLFNFIVHKLHFIDLKIGFILAFIAIMLALLGVLVFRG